MSTSHRKYPDTLIGQRLKQAREQTTLSRREAAETVNDTYNHLKMLELGRVQLSAVWLKRYATLYTLPLDYFLQDV